MPFSETLLERIDRAGRGQDVGARSMALDPQRLRDSVLTHLRKMFNCRQGSVMTLSDYGMPDFNDLITRFPDAIVELVKAIRISLEKYEPRLDRVRVKHVPDPDHPLNLRFEITADLVLGDEQAPVLFETVVGDSGQVQVKS